MWIKALYLTAVFAAYCFPAAADERRIDVSARRGVQEIVLSVKNLAQTAEIYQSVASYDVKYKGRADPTLTATWGLPSSATIDEQLLGLPGLDRGLLRLVKINHVPQVQIRSSARPFDTGGIFNFNAVVKDIDRVFEALRDRGFQGFADPNRYALFGKDYAGALLRGHDGVVINLLQRVNQPYDDLPQFQAMSHIMNATQMVSDYQQSFDFFTQGLGWVVRWEAAPTWPADGSNNMGIPHSLLRSGAIRERAASFTMEKGGTGGSIEIFHIAGITGIDYAARAEPPNLGILTYRVHVVGLKAYVSEIASRGVALHRPLSRAVIAPYGDVDIAVVRAPSGAWIELFEQKPASAATR